MSPVKMSKVETAARTVLAFSKACNQGDIHAMLQFISPDCLLEHYAPAPDGSHYRGIEEIGRFWQEFYNHFSDLQMEIEDIFGMGERCIKRWKSSWTDAAGVKQHLRGVDLFLVRDELIVELFSYIKG